MRVCCYLCYCIVVRLSSGIRSIDLKFCVQMDNLKGMLGVRRIDKMRNERIRELCGVNKGVNERINESSLSWFGHLERMDDSRFVKWIYSGECAGSRPAGRPKKKWIESV